VRDRLRQLWMTPHGLIKAAMASGARVDGKVISLTLEGRDVKVTLNRQNLVERVEYSTDNPVLGDTLVETTYSQYADYGGVKFPARIVEKQDRFLTLDVNTGFKSLAPVDLSSPDRGTFHGVIREAQKAVLARYLLVQDQVLVRPARFREAGVRTSPAERTPRSVGSQIRSNAGAPGGQTDHGPSMSGATGAQVGLRQLMWLSGAAVLHRRHPRRVPWAGSAVPTVPVRSRYSIYECDVRRVDPLSERHVRGWKHITMDFGAIRWNGIRS